MRRSLPLTALDVACDCCLANAGEHCRRVVDGGRHRPVGQTMSGFHLPRHAALLELQRGLARKEFADG